MYAKSYDEYVKQPYDVGWYLTKIKHAVNFRPGFHAFQIKLEKSWFHSLKKKFKYLKKELLKKITCIGLCSNQ